MVISGEGDKPKKNEIEKIAPVPIEQIMKDLAQGYSLTYPLEGRLAKKYKVFKKLGDVRFEIILDDHDMPNTKIPGATLLIFRESKEEKLDGFSIAGIKEEGAGSYNFSIKQIHFSRRPMTDFWNEYIAAEIDMLGKEKAIEADNKLRNAVVELASPNLQLAIGAKHVGSRPI